MLDRLPFGFAIAAMAFAAFLNTARAEGLSVTDDTDFVEYGHYQIYFFSAATHVKRGATGTAAGVEINYGPTPETELSVTLPFDYDTQAGTTHMGMGAAEFGVGYRFIDEDEAGWTPQVIFYPAIEVPLGGNHAAGEPVREFIPLWLQKSFGAWTSYAGGGYWNNPGHQNRNFWFFGWAVLRQVSPDLQLGAEIFHQTADTMGGQSSTGLGIGALYDLNEHFHLVGSFDTGLTNRRQTNEFSYYAALEWTP